MNIIIVVVAIVIAFIVIKFVAKVLFKLIGFIIILLVALYMLFYWNGGLLDLGNNDFMLYELEQKYCNAGEREMCECVIQPLIADVEQEYKADEIAKIEKNKMKSIRVIMKSMTKNRSAIKDCLNMNGADSLWSNFKKELLLDDFDTDLKRIWNDLH